MGVPHFLLNDPVATEQHNRSVECEADFDEEGAFGVGYAAEPGQELHCRASGLDPASGARLRIVSYDLEGREVDEFVESLPAGQSEFVYPVPDTPVWFEGFLFQGEDVEQEFSGTTFWFWEETHEMACDPEPVRAGGTVECTADRMTPGRFWWLVVFADAEDAILAEVEGDGAAETDGSGAFRFDVPTEAEIVNYTALAEQELAGAFFEGTVLPGETASGGIAATTVPLAAALAIGLALGGLFLHRRRTRKRSMP